MSTRADAYCAIDFGTSNSALAIIDATGIRLAELEPAFDTMPTAVFYAAEGGHASYGRAAIAAYVDGHEGRLMRSIKSILGSDLMDETTAIAAGHSVAYRDVVIGYLRRLLRASGTDRAPLRRAIIGRPVKFVDDDPVRDVLAADTLAACASAAGLREVAFEFEPIAAALDYESRCDTEQKVLVADIGGGTSDFSIVRVGPRRRTRDERRDDILANHGVHVAGTDFDRAVNLTAIQPQLGLGSASTQGYPVPSGIYFDLSTWHLVNTLYTPACVAQFKQMRTRYAEPQLHARLLHVLQHRFGHLLAAKAEHAKIEVSERGATRIDLDLIATGLQVEFDDAAQHAALADGFARIVAAAQETLRLAQLAGSAVEALYFTGGSTGLQALRMAIAGVVPRAQVVTGERHTSVVHGLALAAQRRYA